jgi:hypothetical protein
MTVHHILSCAHLLHGDVKLKRMTVVWCEQCREMVQVVQRV